MFPKKDVFGILHGMFSNAYAHSKFSWHRLSQGALLLLIAIAILWRGGRTLEVTFLLGLVAVLLLLTERRSAEERRGVPLWATLGVFAFLGLTILAYLATRTMNYGFDEVVQTVALGLLFLWMARQPAEGRMRSSILQVFVVAVLLACLIGVFVYAGGPLTRFVGTFLDLREPWKKAWPNAWAELLLLAWPIALLLSRPHRAEADGFWKMLRAMLNRCAPAGILLACLVLSFSRAAMIALVGQGVLLVIMAMRARVSRRRVLAVALSALTVAVLFYGLVTLLRTRNQPVQSLTERALFRSEEGTATVKERVMFWRHAWALALQRPLLGWGPGSFRFVQTPLMEDVLATSEHPHNVVLKAAAERGWPAALLLLALLLALVLPFLRSLLPQTQPLTFSSALLLTAVLGVLAHTLVDYNLHFTAVSLPFALVAGMLASRERDQPNKKLVHVITLIFAFGLLLAIAHEGIFATTAQLGRRAERLGKTASALRWYRVSRVEWYSRDLPLIHARLQMGTEDRDGAGESLIRYTTVTNPADARGWILRAELEAERGDTVGAAESLRMAWDLGRWTDLGILLRLVDLLQAQGDRSALVARKEEYDTVLRRYYDAIMLNAHFVGLSRNVEEFLQVADALSRLFPSDEPVYQVMAAGVARQSEVDRERLQRLRP